MIGIHNILRAFLEDCSGDVTHKFKAISEIKPPRRNTSISNKSNRSDYMKMYMRDYRENGRDYQKIPEMLKEWRLKQRKKLKETKNGK